MKTRLLFTHTLLASLICAAVLTLSAAQALAAEGRAISAPAAIKVSYSSIKVDGLNIAYREAGDPKNPKLVLLHGLPAGTRPAT